MNLEPLPTELRPTPALMKYYVLSSLVAGPFFFFPLIPLFARYRSLRYRVDEEGISMRWGILFRREVSLNYARIQDIHLSSNLFERWLGLGKIQVQTASGSAGAEMTIEGLPDLDAMRDFLYSRMRGARGGGGETGPGSTAGAGDAAVRATEDRPALSAGGPGAAVTASPTAAARATTDDLTDTLRAVAAELRAIRQALGARDQGGGSAEDRGSAGAGGSDGSGASGGETG